MKRAAVGGAVLLVVLAVGGRSAVAAPSEAERQARRSFKVAEEHFRAGMFAEALGEYQAGYEALGNVLRIFPIAWQFRREHAIF